MSSVDNRIVQMKFDNAQFEKGVAQTTRSLDDFTKTLGGLDGLNTKGINGMIPAVEKIGDRFTFMGDLAYRAIGRIKESFLDMVQTINNNVGFIANPFAGAQDGFQEYEALINNTKAIGTAARMEQADVEALLDRMNAYADQTIYNFGTMVDSTKKFLNAGIDVGIAEQAILGIANATAYAGGEANVARIAMYNFSQAMAVGFLNQTDFRSINQAGFVTATMKEQFVDAALAAGTLRREWNELANEWLYISTTTNNAGKMYEGTFEGLFAGLQYQWLQKEVILDVLSMYNDRTTELGEAAFLSATQLRTFSMFIDSTKEALGSGWAETWKIVIGGLQESTALWTAVGDSIADFAINAGKARNLYLQAWSDAGGRDAVIEGIGIAFTNLSNILASLRDGFRAIFPPSTGEDLANLSKSFLEFMKILTPTEQILRQLRIIFEGLFATVEIVITPIRMLWEGFTKLFSIFENSSGGESVISIFLGIATSIAALMIKINELIQNFVDLDGFIAGIKQAFIVAYEQIAYFVKEIPALFNFDFILNSDFVKGIQNFATQTINYIKEAFASLSAALFGENPIIQGLIDGFVSGFTKVKDAILSFATRVITYFAELFGIESPSKVFAEFGYYICMGLVAGLYSGITFILDAIATLTWAFYAGFKKMFEGNDFIMTIVDAISGAILIAVTKLKFAVEIATWQIVQWFREFFGIDSPSKVMAEMGYYLMSGLVVGIAASINITLNTLKLVFNKFLNAITQVFQSSDIGFGVVDGIAKGIIGGIDRLQVAISEIAMAIVQWFKDLLGIESPSKVFATLGYYLCLGLVNGIYLGLTAIIGSINILTYAIFYAFKSLFGGNKFVMGLVDGLAEGILKATYKISFALEYMVFQIYNWICEFFGINSPSTLMAEIGYFLVAGLARGIMGSVALVTGAIEGLGIAIQGIMIALFDIRWLNVMTDKIIFSLTAAMQDIRYFVNEMGTSILAWIAEAIGAKGSGAFAEIGKTIIIGISAGLYTALNLVVNAVAGVSNYLIDALRKTFGDNVASNMIIGLINGIKTGIGLVVTAITFMAVSMIAAFCKAVGINSPSKVFYEYGQNIWQGLVNGLLSVGSAIFEAVVKIAIMVKDGFLSVWEHVSGFFNEMFTASPAFAAEGMSIVEGELDAINARVEAKQMGFYDRMSNMAKGWMSAIRAFLEPVGAFLLQVYDVLKKIFGPTIDWIISRISTLKLEDITNFIWSLSAFLAANSFSSFTDSLTNMTGGLNKVVGGFVGILEAIGNAISDFGKKLQYADTIGVMAKALLLLSAAVIVMSLLPWQLVDQGLAVMGAMLVGLSALFLSMGTISSGIKAGAIMAVAASLLLLSVAVVKLGSLDIGSFVQGVAGLVIVFGGLYYAVQLFDMINFVQLSAGLMSVGFSLISIATAIWLFGSIDPWKMQWGIIAIAMALGALGMALKTFSAMGKLVASTVPTLTGLAGSLIALGIAIWMFGTMDPYKMIQGIFGIAVALGAIAFALKTFSAMGKIVATNIPVLTGLAGSLLALAAAIYIFGTSDPWEIQWGIIMIAAALAAIGMALKTFSAMGKLVASTVPTLTGLALSLLALTVPIVIFGTLPLEIIAKGIALLFGAVAVLAVGAAALAKIGDIGATTKQLLGLAIAVGIIAGALTALSFVNMENLAFAFIMLAATIAAFGLAMQSIPAETIGNAALKLVGMALGISLLAASLAILSLLDPKGLAVGMIALFVLITGIIVALQKFPEIKQTWQQIAALSALGIALTLLAYPLAILAQIPFPELLGAFVILGASIAGLAIASTALSAAGPGMLVVAGFILILAAALWVLGKAIEAVARGINFFRKLWGKGVDLDAPITKVANEVNNGKITDAAKKETESANKELGKIGTPIDGITNNVKGQLGDLQGYLGDMDGAIDINGVFAGGAPGSSAEDTKIAQIESTKEQLKALLEAGRITKKEMDKIVADLDKEIKSLNETKASNEKNAKMESMKKDLQALVDAGKMTQDEMDKIIEQYSKMKITPPDLSVMPEYIKSAYDESKEEVVKGNKEVSDEMAKLQKMIDGGFSMDEIDAVIGQNTTKKGRKTKKEEDPAKAEFEKLFKEMEKQQKEQAKLNKKSTDQKKAYNAEMKKLGQQERIDMAYEAKLRQDEANKQAFIEAETTKKKLERAETLTKMFKVFQEKQMLNLDSGAPWVRIDELPLQLQEMFMKAEGVIKLHSGEIYNIGELFRAGLLSREGFVLDISNIPEKLRMELFAITGEFKNYRTNIDNILASESKLTGEQYWNSLNIEKTSTMYGEKVLNKVYQLTEEAGRTIRTYMGTMTEDGLLAIDQAFLAANPGKTTADFMNTVVEVMTYHKDKSFASVGKVMADDIIGILGLRIENPENLAGLKEKLGLAVEEVAASVPVIPPDDSTSKLGDEMLKAGDKVKEGADKIQEGVDRTKMAYEDYNWWQKLTVDLISNKTGKDMTGGAPAIVSALGLTSEGVAKGKETAKKGATEIIDNVKDTLEEGFSVAKIKPLGEAIPNGMIEGIKGRAYAVMNKIKEMCAEAIRTAKKTLDSNSPSKEFITLGNDVGDGFVVGIDQKSKDVSNASDDMANAALDPMKEALKNVGNVVDSELDVKPRIELVVDTNGAKMTLDEWNKYVELNNKANGISIGKTTGQMMNYSVQGVAKKANSAAGSYTPPARQHTSARGTPKHDSTDQTYNARPSLGAGQGPSGANGYSGVNITNNFSVRNDNDARQVADKVGVVVSRQQYARGMVLA